jgi:hypothetical protein
MLSTASALLLQNDISGVRGASCILGVISESGSVAIDASRWYRGVPGRD